jgi:hypothetical protein
LSTAEIANNNCIENIRNQVSLDISDPQSEREYEELSTSFPILPDPPIL